MAGVMSESHDPFFLRCSPSLHLSSPFFSARQKARALLFFKLLVFTFSLLLFSQRRQIILLGDKQKQFGPGIIILSRVSSLSIIRRKTNVFWLTAKEKKTSVCCSNRILIWFFETLIAFFYLVIASSSFIGLMAQMHGQKRREGEKISKGLSPKLEKKKNGH